MKVEINKGYNNYVLEIDDSLYDIKYCKFDKSFVLMTKDGVVLKTFPRTIGFIKQVNIGDTTYFISSNKVIVDNLYKHDVLEQYEVIKGDTPSLKVSDSFILDTTDYSKVVLGSCSFLIKNDKTNEKCIYSVDDCRVSKPYQRVIVDERFKSIIGSNVIVEDLVTLKNHGDIPVVFDIITYGINPDTLKIVSKIYSQQQNRYIDILTEEEINNKQDSIKQSSKSTLTREYLEDNNDRAGSLTILLEIIKPLQDKVTENKEIYDNKEVSDFVKKLGNMEE